MPSFLNRHIGPSKNEEIEILKELGYKTTEDFSQSCLPSSIQSTFKEDDKFEALSEAQILEKAQRHAENNQVYKSLIGSGYYGTYTPSPIQRNVLENPAWYTAYTPYQAEISQGRLEALINFQTMICDLTGMELANSSLLDEGSALSEAATMATNINRSKATRILVDQNIFPQSLSVLKTRMKSLDVELDFVDAAEIETSSYENAFALIVQSPNRYGQILNCKDIFSKAKSKGLLCIAATDLLFSTVHEPCGKEGADIVVGSSQRFGVPMGFGGPHAAFLATKEEYKRLTPGRIIGTSKDVQGNLAYRLALQTREQHIRREKATSNICTAQVLLAVMASMYAVYHGPKRLRDIALKIKSQTETLKKLMKQKGFKLLEGASFDTLTIHSPSEEARKLFESHQINIRIDSEKSWGFSVDETWDDDFFQKISNTILKLNFEKYEEAKSQRDSSFLTHPVFNTYHNETEFMRYLKKLESKDFSLVHGMIPLGSCTMKLNAATEMMPVTYKAFSQIHPHAPTNQVRGYLELIAELEKDLCKVTGFTKFSFQPNSGAQGEYAGLLAIKEYHKAQKQENRKICLIPSSAHGTNPASAAMAGFKIVVVKSDANGNICAKDLQSKVDENKDNLAALMVTYPSTHGVYEENIIEVCDMIHQAGGLVYMDGANMNALVGLSKPADLGMDVMHFNLHKTFCIPHGGGGPGVGPIGVVEKLEAYLPKDPRGEQSLSVSSALYGSASILPISWSYIKLMGFDGLKKASEVAILNANYMAKKLSSKYEILFKGKNNHVAHECILDTRVFKESGVTVDDIAKRLMDYSFHAPTMSWPVVGTLMVEPTESESKEEMDRFCDAMLKIYDEIEEVKNKTYSIEESVLRNAPHSLAVLTSDKWTYSYPRSKALGSLQNKFIVPVGRVDNAYGDRNLFCTCPSPEDFES